MNIESGAQAAVITLDGRAESMLLATFTYGDTGRAFQPTMTQEGTALNLTGATDILLSGVSPRSSGDLTIAVTGSLLVAASGSLSFPSMGTEFAQPASARAVDVYQCQITYTRSGVNYMSDLFLLACQRFPS